MKVIFLLLTLSLFSHAAPAQILSLEYATFYSHLRKIDDEELSALQFAFGFKHINTNTLCKIDSVKITTQKKDIDIAIVNRRFLLPTEKALKQARAMVLIELDDVANKCDMSVQLETTSDWLKSNYSQADLQRLLEQYDGFFSDMGSFLSFLMPSVSGLNIHYDKSEGLAKQHPSLPWKNGQLHLDEDWIRQHDGLALQTVPVRITAITD